MPESFDRELEERLVRYARIHTTSEEASETTPSTERQYDLLRLLADELGEMGAEEITLTDYGAVLATIPATIGTEVSAIAFLAHVDTTESYSGEGVEPIVHRSWDGSDIVLPDNPELVLSAERLPYLGTKTGGDIITASGTTLLGADDKAGVAIIMALARHLLASADIPHGPVRVCFTPDEEIGRGVHENLPQDLRADVAYTLDGALYP
ncbi:MAG TPA: M20/M25/M40 family metallo-hydrolase, partial [Thermomicrobiales bacterium]|nr:M20/M25/M40 family metallo-hydrolase [Thermomicrobiales bacterium]